MISPTHNVLTWEGTTYGLHQYSKNGPLYLCYQHHSGDWYQDKPATQHQIDYIMKYGKPLAPAENGGTR